MSTKESKPGNWDLRIRERNMAKGLLSQKDVDGYLGSLTDLEAEAVPFELSQPVFGRPDPVDEKEAAPPAPVAAPPTAEVSPAPAPPAPEPVAAAPAATSPEAPEPPDTPPFTPSV